MEVIKNENTGNDFNFAKILVRPRLYIDAGV